MRRILPILFIMFLMPLYLFTLSASSSQWKKLPMVGDDLVVLPSPIIKLTSLDYDGLISDFLFLKVLTFYGGTIERKEKVKVKDWEWKWMYETLDVSTDLDPYFFDPYYFATANLTWAGHLVKETNSLLAKGSKSRDWDWWLPFYMGFNEFYFLQDNAKASEYLMVSAQRPDAPSLVNSLATRLAYKSKRTENAIIFIRVTLKATKDKATKEALETRLNALESILSLEKAIEAYKSKFGNEPHKILDLLQKGIISRIPEDPYGGEFYIDSDGSVKTTSNLLLMPK